MADRVFTLDELAQPRWRQLLTRTFEGGAARFVTATLLLVGGSLGASVLRSQIAEEHQRTNALAEQSRVAATFEPAELTMAEHIDEQAMRLAREPWAGDQVAPGGRGAALLEQPGVYFRAVQTEVGTPAETRTAAGLSVKDAVPLCLLQGREATETASACAPGTACLGQATAQVANLRQLHQGLDVLGTRWADDLRQAHGMRVGALAGTLHERLEQAVPTAHKIASEAQYALLVIDEVPGDLPEQMWGSRRDLVQTAPHAVRMALIDARTGETVARIRRELDGSAAPVVGPAAGSAPARRQAYSCQLGLSLREALTR